MQRPSQGLNTVIWQSRVFSGSALAVWTRQLAGLVSAGLPLERALSALAEEAETPRQRDLVSALRSEVNAGAPFAKALAHPARVSILQLLLKKKSCICGNIVDELPLSQSTVSQHLKELKEAGLIKGEIDGVSVCYCINEKVWNQAAVLLQGFFSTSTKQNSCC
jgi:DNA-binding transcriptional ArsR family regulator